MNIQLKNSVLIDLVTDEDSDNETKDTNNVYDGGRQLRGLNVEIKTKISCHKDKHKNIHRKNKYKKSYNQDVRCNRKNEYNRGRYHEKKKKRRRPKTPQFLDLMNSGPAKDRVGSTVIHFNQTFFREVGEKLKAIFSTTNISHKKFLDVGHGLGLGLDDLSDLFGISTVGIEVNPTTYNGSILRAEDLIKKMGKKKYVPFVPLRGDGYGLKTFGGADIVYCWCRGQQANIFEHICRKFSEDPTAKVFITSEKFSDDTTKFYGLNMEDQVNGKFPKGTMMMYFYVKRNISEIQLKKEDEPGTLHNDIKKAFEMVTRFKRLTNKEKTKEKLFSIINWAKSLKAADTCLANMDEVPL